MSQPRLARLENSADIKALYAIGIGLIDLFWRGYTTPPKSIELDIDDTDDLVCGFRSAARVVQHACWRALLPADAHL